MNKKPTTVCQEADDIINGERRSDYGPVSKSFQRIADLWSPILGVQVTKEQVGMCMIQLKISRELNKHKRDNIVDIIGYAALIENMETENHKK